MKCRSACRILAALSAMVFTAFSARADVVPGMTIDQTNYELVRDLLPASVLNWVKKGDLTFVVGEMADEVAWGPEFMHASEANDGHYDVDAEGGLIGRKSGKRPPHTYGFPFPHINPNDPNAGIKVMWNTSLTTYKFGRFFAPFAIDWVGREGFERAVEGETRVCPFDFQPQLFSNPDHTEVRDLIKALSPASVEGIASLSWRYMDNRPDTVWVYTPATRRTRQLSAVNRSEPYLGSDLVVDDGLLWAGKHQSFTWRLGESQDVLVGAVATHYVTLVPGPEGPNGQEWRSPKDFPGARFGMETPGWKGAPWLPTNMVWVKRPVWVVEGHPKDPYYSYGRQLFYIDRSTYKIYYKVIYTPAGEYWKTIINDLGIGISPDGKQREIIQAAIVAVDDRADHATYTKGNAPDFIVEYNSARVSPELFTVSGLLRGGK